METLVGAFATVIPIAVLVTAGLLVVWAIVRHVSTLKTLRKRAAERGYRAESESEYSGVDGEARWTATHVGMNEVASHAHDSPAPPDFYEWRFRARRVPTDRALHAVVEGLVTAKGAAVETSQALDVRSLTLRRSPPTSAASAASEWHQHPRHPKWWQRHNDADSMLSPAALQSLIDWAEASGIDECQINSSSLAFELIARPAPEKTGFDGADAFIQAALMAMRSTAHAATRTTHP
jgi:hypothetical protein